MNVMRRLALKKHINKPSRSVLLPDPTNVALSAAAK